MEETHNGASTELRSSGSVSSDTPRLCLEYTNPWLTFSGKAPCVPRLSASLGVVPENGTSSECKACLLAVYDPRPQPGDIYQLDVECTYIDTGFTEKQRSFLEVVEVQTWSGLITFDRLADGIRHRMQYTMTSWENIRDHNSNNFKWVGVAGERPTA